MKTFKETTYMHFVREFKNKLNRTLTIDEKEFLKWVAKKCLGSKVGKEV